MIPVFCRIVAPICFVLAGATVHRLLKKNKPKSVYISKIVIEPNYKDVSKNQEPRRPSI